MNTVTPEHAVTGAPPEKAALGEQLRGVLRAVGTGPRDLPRLRELLDLPRLRRGLIGLIVPDMPPGEAVWLILLPLRLFLAAGWLRAGVEKLVEPGWFVGEGVRDFLAVHAGLGLPFMQPIADHVFTPLAALIAVVVVVTQLFCGVALLTGRAVRVALTAGLVMTVSFVMLGAVNPGAFYIVMQSVLAFAVAAGIMGRRRIGPAWLPRTGVGLAFIALAGFFGAFVRTLDPHQLVEAPSGVLSSIAFMIGLTIVLMAQVHEAGEEPAVVSAVVRAGAPTQRALPEPAVIGSPVIEPPVLEPAPGDGISAEHALGETPVAEPAPAEETTAADPAPSEATPARPAADEAATSDRAAKPAPRKTAPAKKTPTARAKPAPTKAEPTVRAKAKPAPSTKAEPTPSAKAKPAPSTKAKPTPSARARPTPTKATTTRTRVKPDPSTKARPTAIKAAKPTLDNTHSADAPLDEPTAPTEGVDAVEQAAPVGAEQS